MVTILFTVLVLMLVGALPSWRHSRNWGFYPSGGVGLVLADIQLADGSSGIEAVNDL